MNKKGVFFLLFITLVGTSLFLNPSISQAACYNIGNPIPVVALANITACKASEISNGGTCELCATATYACNASVPGDTCANHGGTYANPIQSSPVDWFCKGGVDANPLWFDPKVCTFADKVYNAPAGEIFGERYTYAQVNWIVNSLATQFLAIMGKMITAFFIPGSNLFSQANTPQLAQNPHSFVAYLSDMSSILKSQPLSGIGSVNTFLSNFDLATVAHAQGYGFGSLNSLQPLWTASRNTAYILMIILLIASGFAIMFRAKMNPQTAVTLQLMIPKIILTLLFVTFSYAIAGLVIDGVFVVLSFTIYMFAQFANGIFPNPAGLINVLIYNPLILFGLLILNAGRTLTNAGVVTTILGPILMIVLFVIMLFLVVKVWWMLIKSYIMFILKIIIGPWQIMLGLLPGNNGFAAWLRGLIADASVFVIVPLMLVFTLVMWTPPPGTIESLAAYLPGIGDILKAETSLITPIDIGGLPQMPILNGLLSFGGGLFRLVVGFALMSLIPKAAEMVQAALKTPAFKYGNAIGEALGFAAVAGSGFDSARSWINQRRGRPQSGDASGNPKSGEFPKDTIDPSIMSGGSGTTYNTGQSQAMTTTNPAYRRNRTDVVDGEWREVPSTKQISGPAKQLPPQGGSSNKS